MDFSVQAKAGEHLATLYVNQAYKFALFDNQTMGNACVTCHPFVKLI